jgi:hypothetical protein
MGKRAAHEMTRAELELEVSTLRKTVSDLTTNLIELSKLKDNPMDNNKPPQLGNPPQLNNLREYRDWLNTLPEDVLENTGVRHQSFQSKKAADEALAEELGSDSTQESSSDQQDSGESWAYSPFTVRKVVEEAIAAVDSPNVFQSLTVVSYYMRADSLLWYCFSIASIRDRLASFSAEILGDVESAYEAWITLGFVKKLITDPGEQLDLAKQEGMIMENMGNIRKVLDYLGVPYKRHDSARISVLPCDLTTDPD